MMQEKWTAALQGKGFAFAEAPDLRTVLGDGVRDWDAFARSWDDLGVDTYMADGGRYRKRRHAAFRADASGVVRKPHQPHYQSRDYNALNGGIARWFEPVADSTAATASFRSILGFCNELFTGLTPMPAWHVEVHQFRIEARPEEAGKPTPEGMHQDGVDWVLVLMVGRVNIAEGETSIHGLDRTLLGSFTLREPLDSALVDDHRVFHGVTPVRRLDPLRPAHRDVLVVPSGGRTRRNGSRHNRNDSVLIIATISCIKGWSAGCRHRGGSVLEPFVHDRLVFEPIPDALRAEQASLPAWPHGPARRRGGLGAVLPRPVRAARPGRGVWVPRGRPVLHAQRVRAQPCP